jgi:hypothetical protein
VPTRINHLDGHVLRVPNPPRALPQHGYTFVEGSVPQRTWTALAHEPAGGHPTTATRGAEATPLTPIGDRLIDRARRTPTDAAAECT